MAAPFPPKRIADALEARPSVSLNSADDGLVGAPGISWQQVVEGDTEKQPLIEAAFSEFFEGYVCQRKEAADHPAVGEGAAHLKSGS